MTGLVQNLLDRYQVPLLFAAPGGDVVAANTSLRAALGVGLAEVQGWSFLPEEERETFLSLWKTFCSPEGQPQFAHIATFPGRTGVVTPWRIRGWRVPIAQGDLVGYLVTVEPRRADHLLGRLEQLVKGDIVTDE